METFNSSKLKRLLKKLEKDYLTPERPEEACLMCSYQKATVKALPCSHQVTCRLCSAIMIEKAEEDNKSTVECALCHQNVERFYVMEKMKRKPCPSYDQATSCSFETHMKGFLSEQTIQHLFGSSDKANDFIKTSSSPRR